MKKTMRPAIFKWRQTEPELILRAVRWYLRYSLSFRDVEELLSERGLKADHTSRGRQWRYSDRALDPPFNVEAMWHDGQFTYRLPLRLGKGRIPSPPRSMEQHPPVKVILK